MNQLAIPAGLFGLTILDVFWVSEFNLPLAVVGFIALSWVSSLVLE